MMSGFFHFQHTLNRLFNNCIKLYKRETEVKLTPPEKTILKKPSLIRVNIGLDGLNRKMH